MEIASPSSLFATPANLFAIPANRWQDEVARGMNAEQLLLYRSNLLGSDLTITNFGGGNTSAKLRGTDPLSGKPVQVLWVKGSGGDIGSMKLDGFATLYMEKLLGLEQLYRGVEHEDDMVGYLPHCAFGLNPRAASIDTPLHAFLPFEHVDHLHPDAVTALAACDRGEALTAEVYGGKVGWLAWKRPGFDLGLRLRAYVAERPGLRGVVLAGHGLICWGDSARSCYDNSVDLIAGAAQFLNRRLAETPAFGGAILVAQPPSERSRIAAALMPRLRAILGQQRPKIGHFSDEASALEFSCSRDFLRLAAIGTSCPDHFLRTKISPLALDPARIEDEAYLREAVAAYREGYAAYYQRCAKAGDPPMRDANPVVVMLPGVGRFSFAADKATARLAGEFYGNAINVMRGACAVGDYVGLDEREAFGIEYWALEEAKLRRLPPPKSLAGCVALITGAAGGIGAASAARLLAEGACVMITDRDAAVLEQTRQSFVGRFGADAVRTTVCDVTSEAQTAAAFAACAQEFGGLDILVANAGIASAAPLEQTTLAMWDQNHEVLAKGYFLTARAAFPLLKQQGGSIVFIGSKNALAATPAGSAYASAKAASLHLARCLALEGAPSGIRVNVVNPDAVIRGSRIWDGNWRQERAQAHGIDSGAALEQHYRERSLLKRDVLPEDVAEAVLFFVSSASAKCTGNIINVDAGNAQAFTR